MTNVLTANLDFSEVAAAYRGIDAGTFDLKRQQHAIGFWRNSWDSLASWSGSDRRGMVKLLDEGYDVPGMKIKGRNTRTRRKNKWSEESGELHYERVLAGEDAILRDRLPRANAQRAVKLEVELAVTAGTPQSVLDDYAVWLSKLLSGLEGGGFQTQIDVVSRCRGITSPRSTQLDTHIRVKSFGKRGSKRTWSALFSPGGFRHLVFCARILGCDQNDKVCDPGMGGSFGTAWDLKWDPKERKLTIACAATTARFPTELMDSKLAAIKF